MERLGIALIAGFVIAWLTHHVTRAAAPTVRRRMLLVSGAIVACGVSMLGVESFTDIAILDSRLAAALTCLFWSAACLLVFSLLTIGRRLIRYALFVPAAFGMGFIVLFGAMLMPGILWKEIRQQPLGSRHWYCLEFQGGVFFDENRYFVSVYRRQPQLRFLGKRVGFVEIPVREPDPVPDIVLESETEEPTLVIRRGDEEVQRTRLK